MQQVRDLAKRQLRVVPQQDNLSIGVGQPLQTGSQPLTGLASLQGLRRFVSDGRRGACRRRAVSVIMHAAFAAP